MPALLQVLICTTAQRLGRLNTAGMPELCGVEYLISCQNPDHIDCTEVYGRLTARDDISVKFFDDAGLSRNRNHALDAATAPYVIIADDDLEWNADGIRAVIDTFEANPTVDIITYRTDMPETRVYPPDGHNLSVPYRFYYAISFEIALRLSSVKGAGLRFPVLAGIGAPYLGCGEELLFMRRALDAGLNGRFIDRTVVSHPDMTTAVHSACRPEVIRGLGATMRMLRGNFAAAIRLPLEAWRSPAPFFTALRYLCQGYIYSIKHASDL